MAVWALALHRIAPTWLAAVVAVALAGCSGAGLTPERTPSIGIVVAEPRGATNLVVVAYVSDGNPPSAAAFTLSAVVRNTGNEASAATTLRFYRSADKTITTDDDKVGTTAVPGLAAADSSSWSAEVTAPTLLGTHYYGACADPVADESDTTDNCSPAVPIEVAEPNATPVAPEQSGGAPPVAADPEQSGGAPPVAADPDLSVSAAAVTTGSDDVTPGTPLSLSVTVTNRGTESSAATTVRFFQSTDQTITAGDTQVGSDGVPALGPSGTSVHSASLTAPATPATYYYGVCLDAMPGDSDTTNDCSSAVAVRVRDNQFDLFLGVPEVNPSAVETGGTFTLSVSVGNRGNAAAPAATLRYYRSTNRVITRSDTAVGTAEVAALAASGGSTKSISLTAPSTVGTYYYGACLDAVPGDPAAFDDCSSGWERMAGRVEVRLPALAADCTDSHVIWCATLTVGVGVSGNYLGYRGPSPSNQFGSLAPDTFTYRGVAIEVSGLFYFRNWPPTLFFMLDVDRDSVPSDGLFGDETFALELDSGTVARSFQVSSRRATQYSYYGPSLTWRRNATVSVTLSHNPVPTATNSTVTTPSDTDYAFTKADFNFMDSYGDRLRSITIDSLPALGNLRLSGADVTAASRVAATQLESGNLTFTPPSGQTGNALTTFTFKVSDGIGDSASYTMTVDVEP